MSLLPRVERTWNGESYGAEYFGWPGLERVSEAPAVDQRDRLPNYQHLMNVSVFPNCLLVN